MAITIKQAIPTAAPVYNPIYTVVDSSNKAQTNFRYICDIFVASVRVARLFANPDPGNTYGVFNVAAVLEKYVSDTFGASSGYAVALNNTTDYQLQYGEQYGTDFDVYNNLANATGTAINMALDYPEFTQFNLSAFTLANNASKFLTNRPRGYFKAVAGQKMSLYAYDPGALAGRYRTSYLGGGSNQNVTFTPTGDVYRIGIGENATASTTRLSANILTTGNSELSESIAIDFIQPCQYGSRVLHFLNRLGGYDWFVFDLNFQSLIEIERRGYTRNPVQIASNGAVSYPYDSAIDQPFFITGNKKQRLVSDWVELEVIQWLEELYTSPKVYLETAGGFQPVTITNTNYISKPFEDLYLAEIEIQMNGKINRQRY